MRQSVLSFIREIRNATRDIPSKLFAPVGATALSKLPNTIEIKPGESFTATKEHEKNNIISGPISFCILFTLTNDRDETFMHHFMCMKNLAGDLEEANIIRFKEDLSDFIRGSESVGKATLHKVLDKYDRGGIGLPLFPHKRINYEQMDKAIAEVIASTGVEFKCVNQSYNNEYMHNIILQEALKDAEMVRE